MGIGINVFSAGELIALIKSKQPIVKRAKTGYDRSEKGRKAMVQMVQTIAADPMPLKHKNLMVSLLCDALDILREEKPCVKEIHAHAICFCG